MFKNKPLIIGLVVIMVVTIITRARNPIELWDLVLVKPMLNGLIILAKALFDSFGLAIIALTIIIRLATLPVTMKQLHATKAMQTLQPKLQELQKKYSKDRQKLNEELMKLYREHGVNPAGCLFPMLIQFPIWIALYQSLVQAVVINPEGLFGLSQRLYSWSLIQEAVPVANRFLWLDLAQPDRFLILPILVAGSMWVLQKMSTMPSSDPRQQSMSRMMLWMMPLMFGFLTLNFPSGLAIYWVVYTIISIVIQYRVTGWGTLSLPILGTKVPPRADSAISTQSSPRKFTLKGKGTGNGKPRSKR